MDKLWVRKAQMMRMLHHVVVGEGGTVTKLAKQMNISKAYAHGLLHDLCKAGDVVQVEETTKRYGRVVKYYSEFHYVTQIMTHSIDKPLKDKRQNDMVDAFMLRGATSMSWYGYAPIEVVPTDNQMELPF